MCNQMPLHSQLAKVRKYARSPYLALPGHRKRMFLALTGLLLLAIFSILAVAYTIQQAQAATKPHIVYRIPTPTSELTTPRTTPSSTLPPQLPPIVPFPTTLTAQITALQAHNRYFYAGNPQLPEVALTFDDGPSPGYTLTVLHILEQYHVKATFFDVGRLVKLYPDLVKAEQDDGNVIGDHSWTHPDLPSLNLSSIETQLQTTSDAITQVIGSRPAFFRPPYGDINANVLTAANALGLTTVVWTEMASDWLLPGTSVIVSRIVNAATNGSIILLHDGGGNRSQTVAALPTIIEQLRAHHYTFVTMSEIAAHNQLKGTRQSDDGIYLPGAHSQISWLWQVTQERHRAFQFSYDNRSSSEA